MSSGTRARTSAVVCFAAGPVVSPEVLTYVFGRYLVGSSCIKRASISETSASCGERLEATLLSGSEDCSIASVDGGGLDILRVIVGLLGLCSLGPPAAFCEDRTHPSQRDLRNIHLADGKLYLQRAIVDHIGLENIDVLLNICHDLQVRGIRCVSHNSEYIIVRTPCLNGSK